MRLLPQFSSFRWIFTHSTCMMAVIRLPLDDDGPVFGSLSFFSFFCIVHICHCIHTLTFPIYVLLLFFFRFVYCFSIQFEFESYAIYCRLFDVRCWLYVQSGNLFYSKRDIHSPNGPCIQCNVCLVDSRWGAHFSRITRNPCQIHAKSNRRIFNFIFGIVSYRNT